MSEKPSRRYFTAALLQHKIAKDKHLLELEVLYDLKKGDQLVFWIDPKVLLDVGFVARGKMEWQPTTP